MRKVPSAGRRLQYILTQYFDAEHLTNEIQTRAINDTTFMTYTLNQFNEDGVSYVFYK